MDLLILRSVVGININSEAQSGQAQDWAFPPCPRPLANSPWSDPEAPTRAIAAQQWFALLRKKVPGVVSPEVLFTLAPNDSVSVCRTLTTSAATVGLGRRGDTAVVVVSKSTTEIVAIFDSSMFKIYLPPGGMAEVGSGFQLPTSGPEWPVLVIPKHRRPMPASSTLSRR